MRLFVILAIISFSFIGLIEAQSAYSEGFYEFENETANMTYTGTWSTPALSSSPLVVRTTTGAGASVEFIAGGSTVIIWRVVRPSGGASQMSVCVNGGSCITIANESVLANFAVMPFVINLPYVGSTVKISQTSGQIYLDSFMILNAPGSGIPTAVPTATILPSSTPASTTTPQPTPTPQPTATPYEIPGAIWAIDPARQYGSINGQITSMEYSATAADIQIANLLTLLVFSVWGFFFFSIFVLVRYKQK